MSIPPEPRARRRTRAVFGAAAAVALVVTVVFATVGDGVEVPEATGLRAVIIDRGHTVVWILLTLAFAVATVRGRWSRTAGGLAVAAGLMYAVFLLAVFLWR